MEEAGEMEPSVAAAWPKTSLAARWAVGAGSQWLVTGDTEAGTQASC